MSFAAVLEEALVKGKAETIERHVLSMELSDEQLVSVLALLPSAAGRDDCLPARAWLCRALFDGCDLARRFCLMDAFFAQCGGAPTLALLDESFGVTLSAVWQQLAGAADDDESFAALARQISWPLLLDAGQSYTFLLRASLEVKEFSSRVIELVRLLPPPIRLVAAVDTRRPVLVTALAQLAAGDDVARDDERADRLVRLLAALARPGGAADVPLEPLVDANALLTGVVLSGLSTAPSSTHPYLLRAAEKLFDIRPSTLRWNVDGCGGTDCIDLSALVVSFCYLHEGPSVAGHQVVRSLTLKALRALSDCLLSADIRLPERTFTLIHLATDSCRWQFKFCVVSWFQQNADESAEPAQLQAPQCLVRATRLEARTRFQEIDCGEHDSEHCALQSLFELAIVDVKLAVALVEEHGMAPTSQRGLRDGVVAALADAMAPHFANVCRRLLELLRFLRVKWDLARTYLCSDALTETAFLGLLRVAPLLLVGDAVVVLLSGDAAPSHAVGVYCQLVKEEIDGLMKPFSRVGRSLPPPQDGSAAAESATSAADLRQTECAVEQLMLQACHLCHAAANQTADKTAPLHVLAVSLTEAAADLRRVARQRSDATPRPPLFDAHGTALPAIVREPARSVRALWSAAAAVAVDERTRTLVELRLSDRSLVERPPRRPTFDARSSLPFGRGGASSRRAAPRRRGNFRGR